MRSSLSVALPPSLSLSLVVDLVFLRTGCRRQYDAHRHLARPAVEFWWMVRVICDIGRIPALLSDMEWVPLVLDWLFFCRKRHRQQGARPPETRLALEFGHAGSVSCTIGRIPGGPGDKWAVVMMVRDGIGDRPPWSIRNE